MKKMILSLCVLGLLTGSAYAACNGGTMRGGFCVSNVSMNWWSAAAWCQAQGMSLATMYDACPDWDGNTGSGKCGRVIDNNGSEVWTSTASGETHAYRIHLRTGAVSNDAYSRNGIFYNNYSTLYYALCK